MERLQRSLLGVAASRQLIGICYTQITDVEQEINGLYTADRRTEVSAGGGEEAERVAPIAIKARAKNAAKAGGNRVLRWKTMARTLRNYRW